jgi:hypothetical protein
LHKPVQPLKVAFYRFQLITQRKWDLSAIYCWENVHLSHK